MFDEIRNCTYQDVDGFFTKYFEGKDWTERIKKIYRAVQGQPVNGRWTDFPDPLVQNAVYGWWFRLQEEFFLNERGVYYTSTSKDSTGSEAQRQVDLFVKLNDGGLSKVTHDWKDAEVIGELKESNHDKKGTLLQIGRYVREVMQDDGTDRVANVLTSRDKLYTIKPITGKGRGFVATSKTPKGTRIQLEVPLFKTPGSAELRAYKEKFGKLKCNDY